MNHTIDPAALWDTLQGALLLPDFCRALGLTADQMERQLRSWGLQEACPLLSGAAEEKGRFSAGSVLEILRGFLPPLADEPSQGWLTDCYQYLLRQIFPETTQPEPAADAVRYEAGRRLFLQVLRGLYHYEYIHCPFDPAGTWCCSRPEKSGRNSTPGNIPGSAPWSGTGISTNSCAWARK